VGTVYAAPPPAREPAVWPMAVAFGGGGAVALAGVVVGYLIGRGTRRKVS
jgi:uncharacterized protein